MKRLILVSALWSTFAFAQQADVTGPELLSGNADAKLQQAAREAKAAGKKLVISAPEYWHDLVLEQVKKGAGDVEIELRDSFAEAVMVRAEGSAPAAETAPAEEPAPVAEAESTPAPAAAAPAPAPTPAPAPAPAAAKPATPPPAPAATPKPAPAPERAPVQAATPPAPTPEPAPAAQSPATPAAAATPAPAVAPPPRPAPEPVATQPAPTPAPAAVAPTPAPAVAAPTPAPAAKPVAKQDSTAAESESIRNRLEKSLNKGNEVTETLTQTELEPGDIVYVQGPVRAVLRRATRGNTLYWLEGDLNLMRVELKELAGSRYQVMERVRDVDSPRLRATRETDRVLFTAAKPAEKAEERAELEKRYNAGAQIVEELTPAGLRVKDILYVGEDLIVVVRLNGKSLERYWLTGQIDLGRSEVIKDGANKYKVLAEMR